MLGRRVVGITLFTAIGFVLLSACGGPSERHCAGEDPWSGTCVMKGLVKLREAEFPVPHVVMEALYEPEANPQSPSFTPPPMRQEFKIMAAQEVELRTFLDQHQRLQCHMQAPPKGSCQPGRTIVALPEFRPTGQTAAGQVRGCAQIEATASQDKLPELSKNAQQMPEIILFDENSAQPNAQSQGMVQNAMQKLRDNPGIECVAVVGQISPGEQQALANERARAVAQALQRGGIEPGRMTTITVTEAVFGTGTAAPPPDPNKRRVTLRILLQRAPGAAK